MGPFHKPSSRGTSTSRKPHLPSIMLKLALAVALAAALASAQDPRIMADDDGSLLAVSRGTTKNISDMAEMEEVRTMDRRSSDSVVSRVLNFLRRVEA